VIDTLMFVLFCLAVAVVAYALVRVERAAGVGRRKGPWRPPSPGRSGDEPPGAGGPG
jgi:hypothetical protein